MRPKGNEGVEPSTSPSLACLGPRMFSWSKLFNNNVKILCTFVNWIAWSTEYRNTSSLLSSETLEGFVECKAMLFFSLTVLILDINYLHENTSLLLIQWFIVAINEFNA